MNVRGKNASRRFAPFAALTIAFLHLGSSDCFPTSNPDAGGYVGPGAPSVEVTVDGVHVGPAPAVSGSFGDLSAQRDQAGRISSTDLLIHAVAANASCDLHFSRFGTDVLGFSMGTTPLESPTGSATAQGTSAPVGPLTIIAGMLTLQCNGSMCDSGILSITGMDTAHIEGFVSGIFAATDDGQTSNTVCTFYVPWRSYQP
jgi:hypothetical protein